MYEFGENEPVIEYDIGEDGIHGEYWVLRRCPECGRFIKIGKVLSNADGEVKLEDWICKHCGPIEPVGFYGA